MIAQRDKKIEDLFSKKGETFNAKDFILLLKKYGFEPVSTTGSHCKLKNKEGNSCTIVLNKHTKAENKKNLENCRVAVYNCMQEDKFRELQFKSREIKKNIEKTKKGREK